MLAVSSGPRTGEGKYQWADEVLYWFGFHYLETALLEVYVLITDVIYTYFLATGMEELQEAPFSLAFLSPAPLSHER